MEHGSATWLSERNTLKSQLPHDLDVSLFHKLWLPPLSRELSGSGGWGGEVCDECHT